MGFKYLRPLELIQNKPFSLTPPQHSVPLNELRLPGITPALGSAPEYDAASQRKAMTSAQGSRPGEVTRVKHRSDSFSCLRARKRQRAGPWDRDRPEEAAAGSEETQGRLRDKRVRSDRRRGIAQKKPCL